MNEDEKKEFYKKLIERANQLKIDYLFQEPCPLYEEDEDYGVE
jgi:hypothetical protein